MITGNINNCEKYYAMSDKITHVLKLLKTMEYEKNASNLTVIYSETVTSDEDESGNKKIFEAHRRYIDIHYIFEGTEQFGYANINTLDPVTEYDEADDYILLDGEASRITLNRGDFVIVFPEDAHIPALKYKKSNSVKRAVVKVLV